MRTAANSHPPADNHLANPLFDPDGFIVKNTEWSRETASQIAKEEGIRDKFFKQVLGDIEVFQAQGPDKGPDKAPKMMPTVGPAAPKIAATPEPPASP